MERLKELKTDIYRCIHCKACVFAYSGDPSREGVGEHKGSFSKERVLYEGMLKSCPAQLEYGWEAYANAGKMWIARSILEGEIEIDDNVADVIYPCITCGLCGEQCENDVRTVDIIEALRAAVLEAGVPARDKHELVDNITQKEDNPYGGKKVERVDWVKEAGIDPKLLNKKDAKIAYFVGCTAAYRQKNIAGATVKLLQKLGLDITVLTEEVCCGSPFFRIGKTNTAQRLMNDNLKFFANYELILFSCAGCYRTFTIDYPKWTGKKNTFKTQHAMELIAQLITDGKLEFKEHPKLKGKTVTYHDPCHTGRHFAEHFKRELINSSDNLFLDKRKLSKRVDDWFEIPRTIIRALPGIKFNEMYRIKENSFCCGAGGGVRAQYPEFSLNTSSRRLDEAEAVGADIMLTECPFCWRNLNDANERDNHGIPVYGILELIDTFDLLKEKGPAKKK
ncbi:MAG: (Fe-S)-binding protein [Candidatus Lokiarchaeota archaeon]|nr:(Fe-S)-binding protein [Candidatus Lokiarchaeota archaeon]